MNSTIIITILLQIELLGSCLLAIDIDPTKPGDYHREYLGKNILLP
jgi:hypothetical protein